MNKPTTQAIPKGLVVALIDTGHGEKRYLLHRDDLPVEVEGVIGHTISLEYLTDSQISDNAIRKLKSLKLFKKNKGGKK